MTTNHQSSTDHRQSKPRQRLTRKQLWFLHNIFECGQPVTDTLRNLRIRPGTLDRWLTKPLFLNRLRMYLNQYNLQARMELARTTPQAISGLAFLSERSLKHKEVRQACNDILNLHTQLAKNTGGKQQAQHGTVSAHFGALLEQFGVVLDNNGAVSDKLSTSQTPKNRIIDTKNAENAKICKSSHFSVQNQ